MKINYSVSDMSELTSLPTGWLGSAAWTSPAGRPQTRGPASGGDRGPGWGAGRRGPADTQDGAQPPVRAGGRGPPASGWTRVASTAEARSQGAAAAGPGRAGRGGHCACSWPPLSPSPRCPHGPRQRPGHLASEKRGVPSRDRRGSHRLPRGIVSLVHLHIWPKFTERPGSRADSGLTARLGGHMRRCHPGQAARRGRDRPSTGRPWA